ADYNADGTLGNSYLGTRTGVQGQGLALQPDGRVVAVSASNTTFDGYVERYTPVTLIGGSDTLTVEDNPNPVAQPDAYDLYEDQTFTSYSSYGYGVLSNDGSPNGGLTASLVIGPAQGKLDLYAFGIFNHTSAPHYSVTD